MREIIDRLLNKITVHPTEKRNIRFFGMSNIISSADWPLIGGTDLQAFQVKMGLTTTQIGMLNSYSAIGYAVSTFLLMGLADKIRNKVRAYAWLTVAIIIYPAVLLILAVAPAYFRRPGVVMPILAVNEVIVSLLTAFLGLIFAVVVVRTISNDIRGRFLSIIGVAGGLLGIVAGLITSQALRYLGYPYGFAVPFAIAICLFVTAALLVRNVREIPELVCEGCHKSASPLAAILRVFKTPEFILLLPPNILRGIGEGAMFFAMATGMKQLGIGIEYAGYTTSLIYLGTMLGNLVIGFTVDQYGPGRVLLYADTIIAISLMGIALAPSPLIFLGFFLVARMSSAVECSAVPLAHFSLIPPQIIGAVSAARLIILTGTAAIVSPAAGFLLTVVSPWYVFGGCAVFKLAAGILYWHALNRHKTMRTRPDSELSVLLTDRK